MLLIVMTDIFLKLLNMSITAGWIVLAIVLLRMLLKKAPRGVVCLLWGLVGIRLVFPFSIESVLSLIPSAETVPTDILYAKSPGIQSGISFFNQAINPLLSDSFAGTPQYSLNPMQAVLFIITAVWLIGLGALLGYAGVSYLRLRRKVKVSVRLEDNVWLCDGIETPFILGVIRPRICLPSGMDERQRVYVLAHERAHLNRCDHLWKAIGYLLLVVYWFHPLIWLGYILLCRDIELACDERVIRKLEAEEKKAYAEVLLRCSTPRRLIAACPLAFGEVGVKQRIKSVLHYKKPAAWVVAVTAVICVVVSVCFLTDPKPIGLNDLREEGYADLLEGVSEIEFVTRENGSYAWVNTDKAELNRIISVLHEVALSADPISQDRSQEREKNRSIMLRYSGEMVALFFNEAYSEVWAIDTERYPSRSYQVRNPSVVKQLFESMKEYDNRAVE